MAVASKTQIPDFYINRRSAKFSKLVLGEEEGSPCNISQFLGVYIDNRLKFQDHIDYVCRRLSSGDFVIRSWLKFAVSQVTLIA